MLKAIQKLKSELESIGATLDDGDYTLNCDAPVGYVWRANGITTIAIHYATNSQSWLIKELKEDGYPRLKMGLEIAAQKDKEEIKWNLDVEHWDAPEGAPETIDWPSK